MCDHLLLHFMALTSDWLIPNISAIRLGVSFFAIIIFMLIASASEICAAPFLDPTPIPRAFMVLAIFRLLLLSTSGSEHAFCIAAIATNEACRLFA